MRILHYIPLIIFIKIKHILKRIKKLKLLFNPKHFIFNTINKYKSIVIYQKKRYLIEIPCNTRILLSTSIGEYQNIYHDVIYKCKVIHWGNEPNKQLYNTYTFIDLKNISYI